MKKAVIYARFSPRRNAAECESVETQIELCQSFCNKNNYDIQDIFYDKALSGSDENRPGLWAAIETLKRGHILVVYKLDRLARSVYLSFIIEQQIKKSKASLISVSGEGTWNDTAEDQLIRHILCGLAEYQRKAQAARTKAAMLRHQANGKRVSLIPPFGYSIDPQNPSNLIENTSEQTTIKEICKLSQNNISLRETARQLQAKGYKCRGARWHHTTVKRILARANS